MSSSAVRSCFSWFRLFSRPSRSMAHCRNFVNLFYVKFRPNCDKNVNVYKWRNFGNCFHINTIDSVLLRSLSMPVTDNFSDCLLLSVLIRMLFFPAADRFPGYLLLSASSYRIRCEANVDEQDSDDEDTCTDDGVDGDLVMI